MPIVTRIKPVVKSFTAIEDKVVVKFMTLRGLSSITVLSRSTTGETVSRFLLHTFKYTIDGVNWSREYDIDNVTDQLEFYTNLATIPLINDIFIEERLVRKGADTSGVINLTDIRVTGNESTTYLAVLDFSGTVFQDINWNDEDFNILLENLLRKLYEKNSILPSFIDRGDLRENDEDYISWIKTIAYFYTLIDILSVRKIGEIFTRAENLLEYLRERGIFLCSDTLLLDMQNISKKMLVSFRHRGTMNIVNKKSIGGALVDGELRRLVCAGNCDEFLYEYMRTSEIGLSVGISSPISVATSDIGNLQLNKTPENTEEVIDLAKYTVAGTVVIFNDLSISKSVARISGSSSIACNNILVSSKISYSISFMVKTPVGSTFSLDTEAFLCDGTTGVGIYDIDTGIVGGANQSVIINQVFSDTSVYHFVKCVIYSDDTSLIAAPDSIPACGVGINKLFNANTKKLNVRITNNSANDIYVYNIKMKPLFLPQNNGGIVNSRRISNIYLKNKDNGVTEEVLRDKIERFLLPLGTKANIKFITV